MKISMNTRTLFGTLLMGILALALAACASQSAPAAASLPATSAPLTTSSAAVASATTSGAAAATTAPAADSGAAVSFSKDLMPIISNTCISCHGGEKTSKGLDMKTFDSLMAGSQNGPVITAGDAANSKLVQSIQSGKMPKRGTLLTAAQLQLFVDWVNAGAKNN
jgi:uncharacterized membrane protein